MISIKRTVTLVPAEPETFTHEGWFAFCPVWCSYSNDKVHLKAKYHLNWLLSLAGEYQDFKIFVLGLIFDDLDFKYSTKSRKLKEPITFDV